MFLFVVFLALLSQCHKAQGYSRITFCYNKNNYEGETAGFYLICHEYHILNYFEGAYAITT